MAAKVATSIENVMVFVCYFAYVFERKYVIIIVASSLNASFGRPKEPSR